MYSAEDVARYIINFCIDSYNPISNLKLQKILYYVQAAFLLEEGKPCFKDEIVKWKHGPVIKEVYDNYVRFIGGVIDEKQDYYDDFVLDNELNLRVISKKFDASIIKENHRKIINEVILGLIEIDEWELVKKTLEEDPCAHTNRYEVIPLTSIYKYFSKDSINRDRIYRKY